MTSNRDIEKLFDQWNPNKIRAGDRVKVSNGQKYQARVVGLDIDIKNKKVYANLKLMVEGNKNRPIRVDVADCYHISAMYPGHHQND